MITHENMYYLKIHPKFFEIDKIGHHYFLTIDNLTLSRIMDEQGCTTKDIKNIPVMVINPETGGYRVFRWVRTMDRYPLPEYEVLSSPDGIKLQVF